jgi:hypothetical protein
MLQLVVLVAVVVKALLVVTHLPTLLAVTVALVQKAPTELYPLIMQVVVAVVLRHYKILLESVVSAVAVKVQEAQQYR